MLPTQFIRALPAAVQPHLPAFAQPLNVRPQGHLVKFWYGADGTVHFEVWIHERSQQLELGLHCEATAERNAQLYRYLAAYLLPIKAALGNRVELEDWDRGWVRLYETHPLWPLDEPRLAEFAQRVGVFIGTVQPIYAEIRAALDGRQ